MYITQIVLFSDVADKCIRNANSLQFKFSFNYFYTDYPDLTEGVGAGSVSGRHEGLEADLTHEVLVNLKQTSELNGDLIY